jgi:hypothetical protein
LPSSRRKQPRQKNTKMLPAKNILTASGSICEPVEKNARSGGMKAVYITTSEFVVD